MAKSRIAPRSPARKKAPRPPLTLAALTIRWKEGDRTVECSGATLAQLLTYHRARSGPDCTAVTFDTESLRAVASLRGLSGLLFPDAGDHHEGDQRFFMSEALAELAATVEADQCGDDPKHAARFTVIVR